MNRDPGTIVVGYDGSAEADVALRWATRTARLGGHRVRAIQVDQVDTAHASTRPDLSGGDDLVSRAEAILASARVTGTFERQAGSVIPVLLEAAREATMLVLGSQRHGWAADAVGRSVSQHIVRHAPCPVVVARAAPRPEAERIIVGVDGSRQSRAALDFACQRAHATHERVVAVHAWRPGRANVDDRGHLSSKLTQRSQAADLALREYVRDLNVEFPDVEIELETIAVPPAQALTDTSAGASLVVTGSRGRSVVSGLLLGSVSHHVLNQAHCPVAVVH
jgi:nucleotide-binding universal stress UspA family protein